MANPLLDHKYSAVNSLTGVNRVIVPFLACGDLSGFDSDKTYPLKSGGDEPYEPLTPTQSPINPPYKTACQLKKANLLDKSSYASSSGPVTPPSSTDLPPLPSAASIGDKVEYLHCASSGTNVL